MTYFPGDTLSVIRFEAPLGMRGILPRRSFSTALPPLTLRL